MLNRQKIQLLSLACELEESMIMYSNGDRRSHERYTFRGIIEIVSEYFNISMPQMKASSRVMEVRVARFFAMYFLKRMLPDESLVEIGRHFGGRDHTTVINAIRKIKEYLYMNDEEFMKWHSDLCVLFGMDITEDYDQAIRDFKPKIKYVKKMEPIRETPVIKFERVKGVYSNRSPYGIASI